LGRAWPALEVHLPACDPQLLELLLAELDDFHPTAIQETEEPQLRVFFNNGAERDAAARALASSFGIHLFLHSIDVDDEDWAARSQAGLRAVTVGRITIYPPWDVIPDPERRTASASDPIGVIIRPSMGFGTGHHATTRLMLQAIQRAVIHGHSVLDVGCGSGVLALVAARLGGDPVIGIDVDPDAIQNASENAGLNDLADRITFAVADFREYPARASVVLANLTGGLIRQSAESLARLVQSDGLLIVSGFMEGERGDVLSALERYLIAGELGREEEWLSAVFRRREGAYRSRQM
jgi:ribosomal protein L11 methyltransferase